ENNLYKLWNRLSSGSYFPPPVRRVDIPKSDGRMRPLGIPTVADRIAQMVVKRHLEPLVEPQFHPDSYGYRPGKSALDAVGMARQRCWRRDWVLDLDIKAFFDSIEPELLMRAVRKHTDCPWALLYIDRWLKAPMQMADGSLIGRERGTPQGGVISPLLAKDAAAVRIPQTASQEQAAVLWLGLHRGSDRSHHRHSARTVCPGSSGASTNRTHSAERGIKAPTGNRCACA